MWVARDVKIKGLVEYTALVPYSDYTNLKLGLLNPCYKTFLKPDLGPNTYTKYGFSEELGRGDSVTEASL